MKIYLYCEKIHDFFLYDRTRSNQTDIYLFRILTGMKHYLFLKSMFLHRILDNGKGAVACILNENFGIIHFKTSINTEG